jgi:hypothetical protein
VQCFERLQSFETSVEGIGLGSSLAVGWLGVAWEDMVELRIAGGTSYFHSSSGTLFLVGGAARSEEME